MSFWQIARLQEFFINYRIGSHKHLDKLLLLPFVLLLPPPLSSSSSSGMRNLDGWMTGRMMGRMDGKDDHQEYYISR
jgi:hypothetical protein